MNNLAMSLQATFGVGILFGVSLSFIFYTVFEAAASAPPALLTAQLEPQPKKELLSVSSALQELTIALRNSTEQNMVSLRPSVATLNPSQTPSPEPQSCFRSLASISRDLDGEWVSGEKSKSEILLTTKYNRDCPAFQALYTCEFGLKVAGYDHLRETQNRYFKPSSCVVPPFSPYEFLAKLKNKRLIMHGNSLVNQMFSNLACTLHNIDNKARYMIIFS